MENPLSDQIFSDGIDSIAIIGGTVRLDFVALSVTEKEANGQLKAVHQQCIVMAPEAFLRSATKIQEAAQTLSKLANARHPSGDKQAAKPDTTPKADSESPTSTTPKHPFP
jgi:hypothetical protein